MKEKIKQIKFVNTTNPKSYFELIRIEELLERKLDHNIYNNHIVNFYIIIFIVKGEGQHTIDFTDYTYSKGSILLIRKDQIHKFFRNTTVIGYLLIFTEEFIVSHLNELEAIKSLQLFNELLSYPILKLQDENLEFANFVALTKQLESEDKFRDEYSIGITRSTLHIMLTKLFRIKSKQGELLSKNKYLTEFLSFQSNVEMNCFKRIKVKDYAKEMGFSTKTLNNIVRSVVNKPAKTFIDEIAIMQIKRLLICTNQSVKEISYTAGFDDPANFFKFFKKYVGTSPDVFRKAK